MMFLEHFRLFIQEQGLFNSSDQVLLAVSGGRDSVLLAHLFQQAGFNFGIAHCNFMLRGAESDADERFVAELAGKIGVPFFSTKLDTQEEAKNQHISIQMAARELRYRWLEQIRKDFDFQYIALAHHQNDTIETMLLNLVRGTGIAGLHGILPKRNVFIRPMLCFSRIEIDQIIASMDIQYRDDSSNLSTKYARNKLRLQVIPLLKELNPSLEETFEANRKRFIELEVILNERISELHHTLFEEMSKDEFRISLLSLKGLKPLHTLLFGLFHPFGFTEAVLTDLSRSWDKEPGKKFESLTHVLFLDRHYVFLSKKGVVSPLDVMIHIDDEKIYWENEEWNMRWVSMEAFKLIKDSTIAQFNGDILQFPLKIRTWQEGDFFYPLGMNGKKKKLSDFFIGQKIPLIYKRSIPIVINGNGDIIYVMGYRIDDRYKVLPQTQKVFIFSKKLYTYGE
ncbi:MAG: tRNA lysidine(34) synthetase TilS [Pedobacter sp.]|nr:MAG: tRNA lysidine(34) synthetase TilS [Pedobacter sp.]